MGTTCTRAEYQNSYTTHNGQETVRMSTEEVNGSTLTSFGVKMDLNRSNMPDTHYVYINRVIKSRKLRWADHVARMEERRRVFKILTDKRTEKRPKHR